MKRRRAMSSACRACKLAGDDFTAWLIAPRAAEHINFPRGVEARMVNIFSNGTFAGIGSEPSTGWWWLVSVRASEPDASTVGRNASAFSQRPPKNRQNNGFCHRHLFWFYIFGFRNG
jgi:hypothetical protein